ncbi:ABC transporter, transmembrane domain, type 1 [Metarhizium guizhouense ARSEF 977]|uniref:ABC transporter, transmembrane domain, type 1 n=1 Tax=Metarhizium guizhouense (strain ARSEF 977) TaxID=1276136 RepID=A0A0B4H3Q3_METGA|nr:ABC transporter, transmembrane domain, type 1 [Metarhizium guizhouense ARSEF 977]
MTVPMLLPLSAAVLGATGLITFPGVFASLAQARHRTPPDNFYQDVDGKATPESMAAFSNKKPKACILVFSVLGFGLSVTTTVLSILNPPGDGLNLENWLTTGTWVAIVLQAVCIGAQHSPVKSHDLGLWTFLSSLITFAVSAAQVYHMSNFASPGKDVNLIVRIVNAVILIPLAFSCISLPRRPDVFYNGEKVDPEWSTTVLSRYTWSWVNDLLETAKRKGDLDEKDIPRPDHTIRAESLVDTWNKANYQGSLLKSLLVAYGRRLVFQWAIIVFRCIIGLGPFWTMLRLVQMLEDRDAGIVASRELWVLVFLMGLFTLAEQWLDGWIVWFSITKLFAPVRGQLAALIFEKSLRRKNVKNAEKTKEDESSDDAKGSDKDKGKKEEAKDDEDSVLKSRQAIVNLVGVDTKHIADFAMMQLFIISSIGKLLVYSGYLVKLIGWIPFGAGILAWSLVLPANTIAAKFYLKAETRLMKNRDNKLAVINEALLGMRQIKFSALEAQWENKILEMREIEISSLKDVFKADSMLFFSWVASPILLAAASLAVYAVVNGMLAPSVAFVSIGVFKSLEVSLSALPELLTGGIDTLVSVRRIDKYLKGPEMKNILTEGHDVAFDNATIAWPVDDELPDDDRFILTNVNLSFPAGELSVISGKTGSGKSLVLNALLGESDLLEGNIYVPRTVPPLERHDGKAHPGNWILPGAVAYVGQNPWLESASLRDNILFGLPFIESRYNTVLDVCALKRDIEILNDGDKTELGANGINLSGGQKWRLTLARAIYSRAEILIMDDIFSAVDAHVGRQIFERCISGPICKGRTRILVTHHVALVEPITKYLVELGEGTVLHAGLTSDLAEDGTLELIKSHEQTQLEVYVEDTTDGATAVNSEAVSVEEAVDLEESENALHKVPSQTAKKFVEDEARAKGNVKARVYGTFLSSSGGWFFWGVCVLLFIAFEAGNLGRNWWVRIWTGASEEHTFVNASREHGMVYGLSYEHSTLHSASASRLVTYSEEHSHTLSYYLWIYVAIATASGIVGTLRFVWSFIMSIKAARTLFRRILFTVLRTRLRWLDTVPVGRVLNRLTADFDIIDNRITMDLGFMFWRVLGLMGVCVAALLVSTLMLPLALVLLFVASFIAVRFLTGARPVKRIESNAKSPVFELFNSSLSGVSTLRAFKKTQTYVSQMHSYLDNWDTISVHIWTLNRWLGFRMALIGTVFTTMVGAIVVGSSFVNAAMAGFTLSFALDFSGNMLMAIRGYASLELDMNAAERVIEYTEVETEDLGGEIPPASWPTTGTMEVKDLVVSYADDLPPVLKGISFDVKNNERIGVIGRTGAGKSSLTLALFRFLEARSGQVFIDGIDISKIRLHDLRSRLAIIPQDPVLFSGTVRSNLDPFDDHTDDELNECLSRVHLVDSAPATPANEASSTAGSTIAPKNTNIFRDLSSGISESGGNLSQGQRQLLCIARAIVSRPKVMVLDEATSAVDMATDALIQRSIREEFTDSTLIVIAHRLSTIADFDRILVLSEGTVAEFGSPRELWETEGSIFRDLCEHSGEKAKLKEVILGKLR